MVVRCEVHSARSRVVEVGEGDAILRTDLVADDNFVDIIEFIPVLLIAVHVPKQGLELRSARHGNIERLCREEGFLVEQVPVVPVMRAKDSRDVWMRTGVFFD